MVLSPLPAWAGNTRSKCTPWRVSRCGGREREGVSFTSVSRPHPSKISILSSDYLSLSWVLACRLSHFSRVQLFATPWTVARQAPLSVRYSPSRSTGVGCHALLQGIFPTQGSNSSLLHFLHRRRILYPLSHLGSPIFIIWILDSFRKQKAPGLNCHCNRKKQLLDTQHHSGEIGFDDKTDISIHCLSKYKCTKCSMLILCT